MQDVLADDDLPLQVHAVPMKVAVGAICPLDNPQSHIRLLRFDRSHEKEPSFAGNVRLETYDLFEAPPYAAISYTWGSEIPRRSLRVDGKNVRILQSSWCAIKQAFGEGSFAHVWIDSVCIDQTSSEEKSFQVQLMSTIYRKAVHVLVSLGPISSRYSLTARQIFRLENDPAWAAWDADAPPAWAGNEDQSASQRRIKILEKWFHRDSGVRKLRKIREELRQIALLPYWTRVWIVQEISLAGVVRLMLGDYTIHWRSLSEFYNFISSRSPNGVPPQPLTLLYASKLPGRMISTEQSLPKVLQTFSTQQCSDPRGRVYGLLSLISWPKPYAYITPDYNKPTLAVAAETLKYGAQADEVLKLMRCQDLERDLVWQTSSRRTPTEPLRCFPFWIHEEEYHNYVNVHPMFYHRLTHDAKGHFRLPFHPVASNKENLPPPSVSPPPPPPPPPIESEQKPIFSTSGSASIVAHIPPSARPDDLIAWHIYKLGWNVATSVGLVLRQIASFHADAPPNVPIYEIVGQCSTRIRLRTLHVARKLRLRKEIFPSLVVCAATYTAAS
ncbi:hypothetical protein BST61_g3823 [Cercospora zeina]